MTQRHRSLQLEDIPQGSYNVRYKAEGYHDDEFTITVAPTGESIFTRNLKPIAQGTILLQSPETVIPAAVYLEEPESFQFYISNTGNINIEYAIRIEFESADLPEPATFLFPRYDSELRWSNTIPSGAYTVNYATVTLPSEAIPEGREEATYDVYVHLLAR